MSKDKKYYWLLTILLLLIPSFWSLVRPGFFPTHDGDSLIIRFGDFHRSFRTLHIPVRWLANINHGYGYPVVNFLYPGVLYFWEVIHFFGFGFIDSVKVSLILSLVLSGLFFYLWLKHKWGDLSAMVGALFYVYAPYRFVDIYVRGSFGEAIAFIFSPLIFMSIDKLKDGKKQFLILGALSMALLILSHNIIAFIFLPLIIFYMFFLWFKLAKTDKNLFAVNCILLAVLAFGMAAFFWLPAIVEKKYTVFDQVAVSQFERHFVTFSQLISPQWDYGPSNSGLGQLSLQIGLLHILVLLVSAIIILYRCIDTSKWKRKNNYWLQRSNFFVVFGLLTILLMTRPSKWAWSILGVGNLVQFPWRLLSMVVFLTSWLAGWLVYKSKNKLLGISLIILVILLNFNYARPREFNQSSDDFYLTNESTTTIKDEYMPIWVKEKPKGRYKAKVAVREGQAKISILSQQPHQLSLTLDSLTPATIQVNTVYFPGWKVFVNKQEQMIKYQENNGLIVFKVDSGLHDIKVIFTETPIRRMANIVSVISLIIIGCNLIKNNIGIGKFPHMRFFANKQLE